MILSAIEIADQVKRGERAALDVMREALERVERRNGALNAFVRIDANGAFDAAAEIDRRIASGEEVGPLAGVPFGVKDNEDMAGLPTSFGSLLYKDREPAPADSTPVARLRRADAIPIGKTAAAEFGLDGITSTKAWGTTRNPWNLGRTPSGSSGGSSAAVAGGLVPLCTASDGGGSIRVPAAFTGLVGLKPTHGRIPRPNGFSDTTSPGVLTMTVADTARCLDILSGSDDRDRMSLPKAAFSYEALLERAPPRKLKALWSLDLGFAPVEPEVAAILRDAIEKLAAAGGMEVSEEPLTLTNTYLDWAKLAGHRLRIRLQREGFYPGRIDELTAEPRKLIEAYGHLSDLELAESQSRIMSLEREVAAIFATYDVLLTPSAATVAYSAQGPLPTVIAGRDASNTNAEPFTIIANCCWNPSVSIPAGLATDGLPVGLLVTGRRHSDEVVLQLANLAERTLCWPRVAPT